MHVEVFGNRRASMSAKKITVRTYGALIGIKADVLQTVRSDRS